MENQIDEKIVLQQPTSTRTYKTAFIIILVVGVVLYFSLIPFSPSKSDYQWILGILIFLFSFPFFGTLFSIINMRIITIDLNTIQVRYAFLKGRNKDFNTTDCIGYFPYTERRGGQAFPKFYIYGLILKFDNNILLKIKTSYSTYHTDQKGKIEQIKQILSAKNIPNFNKTSKESYINFLSLESVDQIARKRFLNINYNSKKIPILWAIIILILIFLLDIFLKY